MTRLPCWFVAVAIVALSSGADAAPRLFATSSGHSGPPGDLPVGLYEVNPETGAVSFVDDTDGRIWQDIAGLPGDDAHLYGVTRLPGIQFLNKLSEIDVSTGEFTDLYEFLPAHFGYTSGEFLELAGISISPADTSLATITAAVIDFSASSIETLFFDLDLQTGAVSDIQTLVGVTFASELALGSNGALFAVRQDTATSRAATIDRSTGQVTELGVCSICLNDFESLEFDPTRGELLTIDGSGQLVRLSPTTGAGLGVIGQTGLGALGGVQGLAFVGLPIPEPGTGALVLAGLAGLARRGTRRAGYGLASNGRGGSRTSSRRA
jgi:hypothetical protein